MSQVVTAPIDTGERSGQYVQLPVAAQVHLYPGTLIALVSATGFVTYAGDVAGQIVQGRAEYDADNTADSVGGAINLTVKRGVFAFNPSSRSSAAYAPTALNVGQLVFVENEQTVQTITGSTNKIVAGLFLGIDPDTGLAWVDTRVGTSAGSAEAFVQTQNSITDNSGGTAAAPLTGVRTIAAVVAATTDTSAAKLTTTQNAISDLAAELNLVKADVATLKSLI